MKTLELYVELGITFDWVSAELPHLTIPPGFGELGKSLIVPSSFQWAPSTHFTASHGPSD